MLETAEAEDSRAQVRAIDGELAEPQVEASADVRKEDRHALESSHEAGQCAGGILQYAHDAGRCVVQQRDIVAPAVLDQPTPTTGENRLGTACAEACASRRGVVIDVAIAFERNSEDDAGILRERQGPERAGACVRAENPQSSGGERLRPAQRAQPPVQRLRCARLLLVGDVPDERKVAKHRCPLRRPFFLLPVRTRLLLRLACQALWRARGFPPLSCCRQTVRIGVNSQTCSGLASSSSLPCCTQACAPQGFARTPMTHVGNTSWRAMNRTSASE